MIAKNKVVSMSYCLKDTKGEELDRSEKNKPLEYLHGGGNIVPGLENGLDGLKVGDKKEVTVKPEEGYGKFLADLKQEVDRKMFPADHKIAVGMQFMSELPDGKKHPFNVISNTQLLITQGVGSVLRKTCPSPASVVCMACI